ncbi:hypothetical protein N9R81_04255, partial [Flavobacteriales bacterium]|nr:hypothetical protein [Flavobacteriales bacterium]
LLQVVPTCYGCQRKGLIRAAQLFMMSVKFARPVAASLMNNQFKMLRIPQPQKKRTRFTQTPFLLLAVPACLIFD